MCVDSVACHLCVFMYQYDETKARSAGVAWPLRPCHLSCSSIATVYFCSSCLCSTDRKGHSCECWVKKKRQVVVLMSGRRVCIHTACKEMTLNHSTNMSTEIKLVYYFQRGKEITKQKAVIFYTSDYY